MVRQDRGPRWGRVSLPNGAVVLREIMERSGIVEWMTPQLKDPRRQEDVVHDVASLIRTSPAAWSDAHFPDGISKSSVVR